METKDIGGDPAFKIHGGGKRSMARIAGVDLPRDKRVEIGLTYIYGIGLKTSQQILSATNVNPDIRVKDLDENDLSKIRDYIDKKPSGGRR